MSRVEIVKASVYALELSNVSVRLGISVLDPLRNELALAPMFFAPCCHPAVSAMDSATLITAITLISVLLVLGLQYVGNAQMSVLFQMLLPRAVLSALCRRPLTRSRSTRSRTTRTKKRSLLRCACSAFPCPLIGAWSSCLTTGGGVEDTLASYPCCRASYSICFA